MDISQMNQAMGSTPPPVQPAGTMTPAQMQQIMTGGKLTPNQSSQALGHSTGLLGTVLSTGGAIAGGIGGAALGAAAGIETGPGAAVTGYLGGVAGAGVGGAAGEALAEKIQGQHLNLGEIAKTGGINAAFEAVGGPLLSLGSKALGAVSKPLVSGVGKAMGYVGEKLGAKPVADAVEKVVAPPVKVATKRISATADMLTKNELSQEASRVTPKGQLLPSDTEKRAGELLAGKTYSNPTKTLTSVKNEISSRGKEAEQFLGMNGRPVSNEEDLKMFQEAKDKVSKYLTPSQMSGYDHAVTQFESELRGMGNMNTGTYYKALKNFEENVTSNLPKGKEALLSDTVSGQMTGAKTVRKVVRDMIGSKHPEFKDKMFDLASLYDAMDNVSTQVANLAKKSTTFAKRHPVVTGAAKYGAEAVGAGALYEGAKTVGAPLP